VLSSPVFLAYTKQQLGDYKAIPLQTASGEGANPRPLALRIDRARSRRDRAIGSGASIDNDDPAGQTGAKPAYKDANRFLAQLRF
jgi:hypothetical protein